MQQHIETVERMEEVLITEKVHLMLLLLGEKRATEIDLYSDIFTDLGNAKTVDKEILQSVIDTLEMLPVAYRLEPAQTDTLVDRKTSSHSYRQVVTILIAGNGDDLERLSRANAEKDHRTLGYLYGFPETAISAFLSKDTIDKQEIDELLRTPEGLFAQFALSKTNYQQELETATRWANAIKSYSPKTYHEFVEELKDWRYSK